MTSGTQGAGRAARHTIAHFNRRLLRGLIAGTLLSSVASAAIAQSTTVPPPPAPQAPQDQALAEIIVTATKRETNLQQTPIAISVANTQSLVDRHALSLFNLADGSIPSLRVATFEARQSALTVGIRGIVPYDQNQTARDNGVTVYLDGVALGKTQGLNAALFDIDRIEVLKGPQGTLFGRNTEGGAVSLVTKAPTGIFAVRGTVGVGNYSSRNANLHIDLPAFANIAIKLDGVYEHQGPTVKDPLSGSTGWNYYDRKGGRAAARWTPVDGLTDDIAYDYARDDNTPQYSQLLNYNPNGYTVGSYTNGVTGAVGTSLFLPGTNIACGGTITPAQATAGRLPCIAPKAALVGVHPTRQTVADVGVPQQPSVDITHGVTNTLKYKVAPHLELRSITAWRGVSTDQWDNSGGPERVTFQPSVSATTGLFSRYSLSFLRQHQFSQEFQAVGSLPNLDYVVGAYYYTEHATEYAATPSTNQWNIDGTGYVIRTPIVSGTVTSANSGYQQFNSTCLNSLAATVPQFANSCQFITRDSEAFDHNYSLFGQATYTPAGLAILHITAGARWTLDRRHGSLFIVNNVATPFTFSNRANRVDPLLTLALDPASTIHLYAKYSTGFRAGGADDRSQRFDSFGPESVKAYEAGAKMDFWDHKARLNIAGYIMNRSDTQFDFDLYDTDAASPTFNSHLEEAINAQGTNHIRGFEADLTVRPVRALTLGASYAYTWWDSPTATNPLTGVTQKLYIVYTPKNAASGYVDYEIPTNMSNSKVRLHLDANYSDPYYSFEAEPTKTDKSFIVNGRVALADIEMNGGSTLMTFALWSRNLLNEQHIYRRSDANSSPVLNFNGTTLLSTAYGGILGDYGNFNSPRTWGAEISFKVGAPRFAPPPPPPMLPPRPAPSQVTCESGVVITGSGTCPPPAPPPPPAPAAAPERGL